MNTTTYAWFQVSAALEIGSSLFRDLGSVEWKLVGGVSGQPIGPIFKGCPETSVLSYHSRLHKSPQKSADL